MAKKKEKEMISIPKSEYDQLQKDSQFLYALEAAGVDNWCGYGEAFEIIKEWEEEDD